VLIILHGLPGVGKSTLAKRLSEKTGGIVLGTNYIRRIILGCNAFKCENVPLMPFTTTEILLSYRVMLYCAEQLLNLGKTVILDATFQKKLYIEMAKELAQKTNHQIFIIKVVCNEEVCKERLTEREKLRNSDSIVGYAHHVEVKEKIFENYPEVNFTFDSSREEESQYQNLYQVLEKYL